MGMETRLTALPSTAPVPQTNDGSSKRCTLAGARLAQFPRPCAPFENGTIRALLTGDMTPFKRHQVGAPEIIQFFGLLILIGMDYKYFGRGVHIPLTLSAITVVATGLFLLIWPMSLKARER